MTRILGVGQLSQSIPIYLSGCLEASEPTMLASFHDVISDKYSSAILGSVGEATTGLAGGRA